MRRAVTIPSTSNADDLAFGALVDAVTVADGLDGFRIVGGHMVGLLLAAFPVPGLQVRRTIDADAGLSTELAAAGSVVERLRLAGYSPTAGNRFERQGRTIDLLVESLGGRFRPRSLGGRQYDASPGFDLALLHPPITVETTLVFTDGSSTRVSVPVPTVELATLLKAYSVASRRAAKDLVDLSHLLEIRQHHGAHDVGGWGLDRTPAVGRRLDVARILRGIRGDDPRFAVGDVDPIRFTALVREHIAVVD